MADKGQAPAPPFQAGTPSPQAFLQRYWQRHPCVLSGWLPRPPAPLGLKRLLHLATQEGVAARRVQGSAHADHWSLDYGPFENGFSDLPECDWTLLVQDVDKHHAPAAALLDAFNFLPRWLIDDIMVSHAAPGGSVGPHVDRYDVFLVQVHGARHWQLATNFDPRPDARFELPLLAPFTAEHTHCALPGDILYIPGGVAHHGVAEAVCETWSVGLRTPAASELLDALAGWVAGRPGAEAWRLKVAPPDARTPSALSDETLAAARELLAGLIHTDDDSFARFLGEALTGYRLWSGDAPTAQAGGDGGVRLNAAAKVAWREPNLLFVNGESRRVPPELGRTLCLRRALPADWMDCYGDRLEAAAMRDWLEDLDALAPCHERPQTS